MLSFTSCHLVLMVLGMLCVGHISSQLVRKGTCPNVPPVKNFDVKKMVGVWYLQYLYYYAPQANIKCSIINMTLVNNSGQQELTFTEKAFNDKTDVVVLRQSTKVIDPTQPAISINKVTTTCFNDTQQCKYVSVDYNVYYVIYCCREYQKGFTYETLGVRTRNPKNPIPYLLLETKLRAMGISPDFMYPVQENCPIYP